MLLSHSTTFIDVLTFSLLHPGRHPSSTEKNHDAKTPAKRLTWQERPEDSGGKGLGAARKREWGEVTPGGSGGAAPMESVYPSPMSSSTSGWGQQSSGGRPPPRSSTPRERETPSWVFSSGSGGGGGGGGGGRESTASSGVGGGDGDGSRKGEGWRRASADLGPAAMAAAAAAAAASAASDSGEDSLGYPLLPCDGRECKIRIVERLGEIKGSRASSGASEAPPPPPPPLESGGNNSGGAGGGGSGEFVQGLLATEGGGSGPDSGARQRALVGRVSSSSSSGGLVLGGGPGGGEIDDTELNELGDSELEGLLEQMWMQVMGQVRRETETERGTDNERQGES